MAAKVKPRETRGKRAAASGAPLRSMRVSDGFRGYVLDQLAAVPGFRSRAMFGGIGLYAHDVFFGIVAADELFFKVDDSNRADYERAGSSAFRPYDDKAMTMPYFNVPVAILEDAGTLRSWASRAVAVASAAKTKKTKAPGARPKLRRP